MSAARNSDSEHIVELFAAFGPVAVRRMFGGAGIFSGGVMIGLVDDGVIYLKADAAFVPAFEREGMGPFTYSTKVGRRSLTSYWRMPERLYDDPEELARWAARALTAAQGAGNAVSRVARPCGQVRGRRKKP